MTPPVPNRRAFAALLCLLPVFLSGCGQKGPLYLPGEGPARQAELPLPSEEELPARDGEEDGRQNPDEEKE